jgi:hypothetical protein
MPKTTRTEAKSPLDAVQAVYDALEPLDDLTRARVLASVGSLLGMPAGAGQPARVQEPVRSERTEQSSSSTLGTQRPISPVELLQEKHPSSNAQKIALFAYYREKAEGLSRFSRADLRTYFAKAKQVPPQNYDRDFGIALKSGWIHEDGADSYLTSRGLEVVESGFSATGSTPAASKHRPASKAKIAKKKS